MHLLKLPTELILDIAGYLEAADLAHLCSANRQLNSVAIKPLYTGRGCRALSWAAENGEDSTIELALHHGADIDAADPAKGMTALHFAAEFGNTSTMKLLIDNGASMSAIDDYRRNVFSLAIRNHHLDAVRLLLQEGLDPDTRDGSGYTALHRASERNSVKIAELLLVAGAQAEPSFNGPRARSPFHFAASNNNIELAELLLEHGADPEPLDSFGVTPLYDAVDGDLLEFVRWMLARRLGNPSFADGEGKTLLHRAVSNNSIDMAQLLIENGADIDARVLGLSPLSYAVDHGYLKIVETLTLHGASAFDACPGGPPLILYAAVTSQPDVVDLLLKSAPRTQEASKLIWKNAFHELPVRRSEIVKWCLDIGGVDVNSKCSCGCKVTALHAAARDGELKTAELLLENGADPTVKARDGLSVMDIAGRYDKREVIELLKKWL